MMDEKQQAAYHEMECCCESTCDKSYVRDYVEYLENRIKELEKEKHNGNN